MTAARPTSGVIADRIDMIATLACADEIEGFREGAAKYGNPLTPQERAALTVREAELAKAVGRR